MLKGDQNGDHTNMTTLRVQDIRATVDFAVDGLQSLPDCHLQPFLADFPNGSCDVTSYVIGHLLTDRSLGRWHVVTYESDLAPSTRHTWLELPDGVGGLFTVDATLHQFADLADRAYIGGGANPALARFSRLINDESFPALSEGRWSKPMFEVPLRYVRSIAVG